MLFCDVSFIFVFLPVFLLVYYLTPEDYRNLPLLAGSLFFYAFGELKFFPLLLFTLFLNYFFCGLMAHKKPIPRKIIFSLLLLYDFGTLLGFKYFSDTIPLGISFYTFQIAAYAADVYLKKTKPARNFVELAVYLCMFPQLIAGPILLYQDIRQQIRYRTYSMNAMEQGLKTFVLGLASKILIADVMGKLWNQVQVVGFESISTPIAWLGAIAFSIQIYFDFYGYSLMAMGLGKMLGFDIPKNFDRPYSSHSVSEFYRRWHITLGAWFREYVYIPLGGSREGNFKTFRNLFAVWILTGIWHGSHWNFILWGMFNFLLIVMEKFMFHDFLKQHPWIAKIYILCYIPINWMIFAITDVKNIGIYLGKMFPFGKTLDCILGNTEILWNTLGTYGIFFVIAIFFCSRLPQNIYQKYQNKLGMALVLTILFWLIAENIVKSAGNPFLYFRF